MTIKNYLSEIEKHLKNYGKSFFEVGFRTGATLQQIQEVEKHCNVVLPEDYKEFLSILNGQTYQSSFTLIPNVIFFGTDDIIRRWNYNKKFFDENFDEEFKNEFMDNDKIRTIMFHDLRIPIGENEGCTDLYFDLIPAPNGSEFQLIANYTECDFVVLTKNFKEILKNYIILIEKGILRLKYENDIFLLVSETDPFFEINEIRDLFNKFCKKL